MIFCIVQFTDSNWTGYANRFVIGIKDCSCAVFLLSLRKQKLTQRYYFLINWGRTSYVGDGFSDVRCYG